MGGDVGEGTRDAVGWVLAEEAGSFWRAQGWSANGGIHDQTPEQEEGVPYRGGPRPRGRSALERGGPRLRGVQPSCEADLARGGVQPSSEADLA
jgi:hypothetical protein